MRCCYFSDLHLESQDFRWPIPKSDVLIVAGDLCNACCLDPARTDRYSTEQRTRVHRFLDKARASGAHVLFVAGNHEHFDGIFDDTIGLLRGHMPGVTVLDNDSIEIGGVRFFGTTLWTDFEGREPDCINGLRRAVGDFLLVKTRTADAEGEMRLRRFQPEDALAQFDLSRAALERAHAAANGNPVVVVSHHAPSLKGLNPQHAGNGRDGAFASDLDALIAELAPAAWVHGHTHIARTYRVSSTAVHVNCRGYDGKDASARGFTPAKFFEVE